MTRIHSTSMRIQIAAATQHFVRLPVTWRRTAAPFHLSHAKPFSETGHSHNLIFLILYEYDPAYYAVS